MTSKYIEAYCSDCQIRNRYAVIKSVRITSLAINCKLCDRKLKIRSSRVTSPPLAGFLLGRLATV